MMTGLLIIHSLITLALVGMVLLQRSEGGGLGIGGGGGGGGFMTTRGTANAMTRATMYLAVAFFATSITLGIMAGSQRGQLTNSVIDSSEIGEEAPVLLPTTPSDDSGLPTVPTED